MTAFNVLYICIWLYILHRLYERQCRISSAHKAWATHYLSTLNLTAAVTTVLMRKWMGVYGDMISDCYGDFGTAYFMYDIFLLWRLDYKMWYRLVFTLHHSASISIISIYRFAPTCKTIINSFLLSEVAVYPENINQWMRVHNKGSSKTRFTLNIVKLIMFIIFRIVVLYDAYQSDMANQDNCVISTLTSSGKLIYYIWWVLFIMQIAFIIFIAQSCWRGAKKLNLFQYSGPYTIK
jgi:hypothetical protein